MVVQTGRRLACDLVREAEAAGLAEQAAAKGGQIAPTPGDQTRRDVLAELAREAAADGTADEITEFTDTRPADDPAADPLDTVRVPPRTTRATRTPAARGCAACPAKCPGL
ncbi:hypothetical protein [Saccharopolyspora pogona]|uniref:hypothetical protein n=1 Tax=Saccharopolyspora pogona TaxID=333966 RepID=UPI00168A1B35|nr:hypothetical protein [Saccharopolyspora pogona]